MKFDENANYKANPKAYIEVGSGVTKESSELIFDNLEWLTTAEAAYYLRKSKDAIRQMVCRGQLRARKFHRRLYFRKVELDQALDISFY
jgi:excisionase family DNA binding protein